MLFSLFRRTLCGPPVDPPCFKRHSSLRRTSSFSFSSYSALSCCDAVVCVINSGRHKEQSYDPYTGVSTLQGSWVSKASEQQRRGRAGRVRPGICFHMYSRTRSIALQVTASDLSMSESLTIGTVGLLGLLAGNESLAKAPMCLSPLCSLTQTRITCLACVMLLRRTQCAESSAQRPSTRLSHAPRDKEPGCNMQCVEVPRFPAGVPAARDQAVFPLQLQDFQPPEIKRCPLDELSLQVKLLRGPDGSAPKIEEFLSKAPEPPLT